ncbi:Aldehyde/histidinol dehydrogenase [Chaetomium strumarium]|uniref:aldehyde dehydrogenase (NAD(+)) n=1 Tax=Chaetomium strumarium TaxID=1170767 RepID=A0AAJ0GS69_9PEZI|nr:Aldehyde/histidinol dehydrogenase [Chaetomium strumarium]
MPSVERNSLYLTLDYILNNGVENKYRWGLWVGNTLHQATNVVVDDKARRIVNHYSYQKQSISDPTSSRTRVVILKVCDLSAPAVSGMGHSILEVEPFANNGQPPAREYQWTSRVWVKYVLNKLKNRRLIQLPSDTDTIEEQALLTANLNINYKGSGGKVFNDHSWLSDAVGDTEERTIYSTRVPLGIVAAIVPWNWPILLGVGKVGPALMTGNTITMKPSPYTPYCKLELGELAMSIFPPGVFQVLSGDGNLGPWMTEHPDINMISFTGSIPTGKKVAASCAKSLKRYVFELDGNDAAIVCDDVDIETCLPKITTLAFLNSGQICMLCKRIYFRDAMVEFTKRNIKTGGGFEPDVVVGPLQNPMQYEIVKDMYAQIEKSGWKVVLKGKVRETSKGYFIEPAIIDNPPEDSRIVVEERFGPIVPLLKWSSEEDVVHRANALETGLGTSIWSRDLVRAERMAHQINAGSVCVNSHFDVTPNVPFGGHKGSGIGMEWGLEGFRHFTNSRSIWVWKKVFS